MLRQDPNIVVEALVTSVNQVAERVAMHAVRQTLLEQQAEAAALPLHIMPLPWPCPNGAYETAAAAIIGNAEAAGVTHMAFGDLFLEDIRSYRENLLKDSSIEPLFPIWRQPTDQLAHDMIASGQEAYLTCVDPKVLPAEFAGRRFDQQLLDDLPAGVDPCGENGEFHSFVSRAPVFDRPIDVTVGERVTRDGFVFADVIPAD